MLYVVLVCCMVVAVRRLLRFVVNRLERSLSLVVCCVLFAFVC